MDLENVFSNIRNLLKYFKFSEILQFVVVQQQAWPTKQFKYTKRLSC